MKLLLLLVSVAVMCFFSPSWSQVFWTETFGAGCNTGTLADGFVSSNGTWNVTSTGLNGPAANVWYISAEENAEGVGNCGAGCGNSPTLHIGRFDGDAGATYLKDSSLGDPTTDVRIESPVIDCSNECQIVLSFDLIHNGDLLLDNCIVWYFDGASWSTLGSPKKTLLSCTPLGFWEDYSIYLPASASNNPNVQIGFQWLNNADGVGEEPSIAIHNLQLASDDIEAPVLTCPVDVNAYVDQNCDAQIPDLLLLPTILVTDNCTSIADILLTQSIPSGTILSGHLSVQQVEILATDLSGNSSSCLVDVRAIDSIAPIFVCPPTIQKFLGPNCEVLVDDLHVLLSPSDNCSLFSALLTTQSPATGTTITADQLVEYSVTDEAGNSRTCSVLMEVVDTISPQITCPVNQTQLTALGVCDTLLSDYTNMVIWSDNCTASVLDMTFTQVPAPLSIVSGNTTIQILVEDPSGNESTCSFSLVVEDLEAPQITCPSNQIQATNAACNINLLDFTGDAIASDNCTGAGNLVFTQSPAIGSLHSGVGTIVPISLTTTDEEGNSNSCLFQVELIDTTAPEAFCPSNTTVSADANCEYLLADFTGAMAATDNCTSLANFVYSHQTPIGTVFNAGVHEITLIAEDQSGNQGTCTFDIQVVDVTDPVITSCVPDQIVLLTNGCEGVLGDYSSLISADDACDGNTLSIVQVPAPGTVITAGQSVTMTVSDVAGNSAQCTFNVSVSDQEAPSIVCQTDTIMSVNAACEYGAPDLTGIISGTDNCSVFSDMIVSQLPAPGTLLTGTDQVEVFLEDENGNQASCIVVTVPNDLVAPQITCPSNQVVNNGANCNFTLLDYMSSAVVVENCPGFSISQTPAIGSTVSVGMNEIFLTVTDVSGNEETCSFMLEIIENEVPTIICPSDLLQCDPLVTYLQPVGSDNCVTVTINQTDLSGLTSGDIFPVGLTTQSFEVIDGSGNTATCSFTIEVVESPDAAVIIDTPNSLCDTTSVVLTSAPITSGTGEWIVLTGTATLNNQFASTTGANNLSFGTNQFIWEVTTASCGTLSDTITIEVYDLPFPASIPNDTLLVCYDTLINLTGNTPNVGVGTWFSTNSEINFLNVNQSNTVGSNLSSGWNDIIWGISNGTCPVSTDTVRVFLAPEAIISTPDTTLCVTGNSIELQGNLATVGMSPYWYVISGGANVVSPQSANTLVNSISGGETIIVYALSHPVCGNTLDTIAITVIECEAYAPVIPTVFTPNNDGKNDLFIIDNLHAIYPTCEVKIVNRWGNLVFESIGYLDPWDGTLLETGELLPIGTYFYRLYLNDDAMTEITGSISIIR